MCVQTRKVKRRIDTQMSHEINPQAGHQKANTHGGGEGEEEEF